MTDRRAARTMHAPRALLATMLAVAACAPPGPIPPAPPLACPALPAGSGFRAGFARIDITTPPGPGMLGYGPEGLAARGYRQRIHARAAAFEDARGERIVMIVADLDFISAALQRAIARRIASCTGLGADRIVVSATHTHSAPGHFSGHVPYDRFGTSVDGFDPAILDFFATRLSRAALDALAALRPARAAWGERPVWGITRVRSWTPHATDPHALPGTPPATLTDERYRHVDPTLLLLRVDTGVPPAVAPAGGFATFAMHGTGVPAANDLLDADVHGVAARVLERAIDNASGGTARFAPRSAFLLANSAEGDVLPARDSIPECDAPVLRRAFRPAGRGAPPGAEAWIARPGFDARACVDAGLERTRFVGDSLGAAAVALFQSLSGALRTDVTVSVAFEMVALRGPAAIPGLCERGRTGTATTAGAETGRTRLLGFRLLGAFPGGFESGGSAIVPGNDCNSPKKTIPPFLERMLVGEHPFEEAAQFSVVRIGDALLATVPFEATTTVGQRMRQALVASVGGASSPPAHIAILGLTNGYINYVSSAIEYRHQYYEGASTLYGPGSEVAYTVRMTGLARLLAAAGWASPPATIPPFPFPTAEATRILPVATPDPRMTTRTPRLHAIDRQVAIVRFDDWLPGAFTPADAPLLVIERQQGSAWDRVTWDDDPAVEVRVVSTGRRRALWQVRWAHGCTTPGVFRVRVLARATLPEETAQFTLACS